MTIQATTKRSREARATDVGAAARYLYPALAGVCIFLAVEPFRLWPLLFALPWLLHPLRRATLKQKLLGYWLMAVVTNLGGYFWITHVAQDFGGLPLYLALGVLLLFSAFNNLNFVVWAYLERFFGERVNPFVTAVLFVVTEQAYPQVFPWYLGTTLDAVPVLYQSADVWGVIGLSFLTLTVVYAPYWFWHRRNEVWTRHRTLLFAQVGLWLAVLAYGSVTLRKYSNEPGPGKKSVGITLVQSNTTLEKFYGATLSRAERLQEFHEIVNLTRQAIAAHPGKTDLVVWPEGAVHFPILNTPEVFETISTLAREHGVYLTAGSVELGGRHPSGRRIYYNTQFVLDPNGEIVGKYRKIVLLAFGEYIPLVDTFPFLEKWLPQTISHFTRGTEKPVFELGEDVRWLPLICYEDIISGFIHGFPHRQADFMVNITNDGWFGKTPASHLHKQMARPRSVEFRKPLVRALNTGSSQVIDAAGRIISKQTELYVRDYINLTLHLPPEPPLTVYAVVGNWPIYILMALVALLWLKKRLFPQYHGFL